MPTPRSIQPQPRDDSENHAIVVEIGDTQRFLRIDPGWLSRLARQVLVGEGVLKATISIALVDDQTIHRLNRYHLGHDWPTDVISFPLSGPGEPELAGELVVSAETAQATALSIGADPRAELALYVVHGLLHLCGYDDDLEENIRLMRRREHLALEREGLTCTRSLGNLSAAPERQQEQAACSG